MVWHKIHFFIFFIIVNSSMDIFFSWVPFLFKPKGGTIALGLFSPVFDFTAFKRMPLQIPNTSNLSLNELSLRVS